MFIEHGKQIGIVGNFKIEQILRRECEANFFAFEFHTLVL